MDVPHDGVDGGHVPGVALLDRPVDHLIGLVEGEQGQRHGQHRQLVGQRRGHALPTGGELVGAGVGAGQRQADAEQRPEAARAAGQGPQPLGAAALRRRLRQRQQVRPDLQQHRHLVLTTCERKEASIPVPKESGFPFFLFLQTTWNSGSMQSPCADKEIKRNPKNP